MVDRLAEQAKRVETGETPWLGAICWFVVPDLNIPHDSFTKLVADIGLTGRIPPRPSDVNVFRRAASAAERRNVDVVDGAGLAMAGVRENWLVRSLPSSDDEVCRRLVRETVDTNGRRLSYDQVADICFDRRTGSVRTNIVGPLFGSSSAVRKEICAEVAEQWRLTRGCLDDAAVRSWLRDFLLTHGATSLRPGVYFVSAEHSDALDGAGSVIRSLPQASFSTIPLVDDQAQREMVKEAFIAETHTAIHEMARDMRSLPETITLSQYSTLVQRFRSLQDKTGDYASLLSDELGATRSMLGDFRRQVESLQDRVDYERRR